MSLIHSKVSTSCGKSKAFHCSLYLPPSHTRVPYIQYSIKISFSSYPMNARHALDLRVPRPYMHTHTPPCHLPYSQSWYFPLLPRLPQQNFNPTQNSIASTSQKPILAPSTTSPTQLHRPQTAPHPSRGSTSGPRLARPQPPP